MQAISVFHVILTYFTLHRGVTGMFLYTAWSFYFAFSRLAIGEYIKLRLFQPYILPVLLYGAETWTRALEMKPSAVQRWCLRRGSCASSSQRTFPVRKYIIEWARFRFLEMVQSRRLQLFGMSQAVAPSRTT